MDVMHLVARSGSVIFKSSCLCTWACFVSLYLPAVLLWPTSDQVIVKNMGHVEGLNPLD